MIVARVSDRGPSDLRTDGTQSIEYAVTESDGKHPSLANKRVRQEKGGFDSAPGRPSTSALFLLYWLIACPSTSASYSQRSATAWRQTTHEHNTGGS